MRYLIDTNIFIAVTVRRERPLSRRLHYHWQESALSVIVLHELYALSRATGGPAALKPSSNWTCRSFASRKETLARRARSRPS